MHALGDLMDRSIITSKATIGSSSHQDKRRKKEERSSGEAISYAYICYLFVRRLCTMQNTKSSADAELVSASSFGVCPHRPPGDPRAARRPSARPTWTCQMPRQCLLACHCPADSRTGRCDLLRHAEPKKKCGLICSKKY